MEGFETKVVGAATGPNGEGYEAIEGSDVVVITAGLFARSPRTWRFPTNRVLGQAGMLDTARFSNFVAEALSVLVGDVRTLTLGSHGDTMVPVPVPSRCTVGGKPLADVLPVDKIDELVVRTRNGGAEVVALLKTGSAYYAHRPPPLAWRRPSPTTRVR